MKKVLLCLLLVMSLLLIPMAMLPMVGANPPPVGQLAMLAVPVENIQTVGTLVIDKQIASRAGDYFDFALLAAGLVLAGAITVRKKPIHSIFNFRALVRRGYHALNPGGASLRGTLNCPT